MAQAMPSEAKTSKKKAPPKKDGSYARRKVPVSRKTQLRYVAIVGGILFLYSLVLMVLIFYLVGNAIGESFIYSEQLRENPGNFGFMLMFSLVSCFLIALILVDLFFKPFYQIKEKVFRLSDKNLTTRLDLLDNEDFQELSEEFNQFLEDFEKMVIILRLEQEEVSMSLLRARKDAHLRSTKESLDHISKHSERIIDQLLSYRVTGDK